ncbi:MAG: tetratricopeptide repeat protein [Elusimicrobiota bacterium]|jgi:tetratricopeptide (TPR) repeat protein|nr:tetratricopeptide repeat protein [Elusimicrobiota bacterium]
MIDVKKLLFAFVFLNIASFSFGADAIIGQVGNAQKSFDQTDYAKAIDIYESLIKVDKINDPDIYYNLSNSYFRNSDIGRAVLNIERAWRLKPRDADINYNRQFLFNWVGRSGQLQPKDVFFVSWFSLNELTVFASVLIILLLISLTAFIVNFKQKKAIFKKSNIILAILVVLSVGLTVYKFIIFNQNNAVLVAPASLKQNPFDETEIASLADGRILHLFFSRDGYAYVEILQERQKLKGWVLAASVEKI